MRYWCPRTAIEFQFLFHWTEKKLVCLTLVLDVRMCGFLGFIWCNSECGTSIPF